MSCEHYSGARGNVLCASHLQNRDSIPDTSPGCGAPPPSNSMGDKRVFPSGLIRSQRQAHHPPQPTADVHAWSHTFTPPTSSQHEQGQPSRILQYTSFHSYIRQILTELSNGCNSNYNFHFMSMTQ